VTRCERVDFCRIRQGLPVEIQACGLGLLSHPEQRDVGELPILVAAPHIRMRAREPDLLNVLHILAGPQGRNELVSMFVDG
jgi:hypothetical protein